MDWRQLNINERFLYLQFNDKLMKLLRKLPSDSFADREFRFYKAGELINRFECALRKMIKRRKANESSLSKLS